MRRPHITNSVMDAIVVLMDDEKREKVHYIFAPCTNEKFLEEYVKLDPDFEIVLYGEFGIRL